MKVIIAGSREVDTVSTVTLGLTMCPFDITEVVSGGCRGIDRAGELWAEGAGIPVKVFRAAWDVHGKAAGPIRNKTMADYADALVAFRFPDSRGTNNMIDNMKMIGKPVFIINMKRTEHPSD